MEDSTSSIHLLSMKTVENNNLQDSHTYKLDFDVSEKMEDTESPTIIKKKRRLRDILGWSAIGVAVLLLIALIIVLLIKFAGDDPGDKGSIFSNTTFTTISPTPSLPPSSTLHPSTTVTTVSTSSTSTSSSSSSITTNSTSSVVTIKPTSVISSVTTATSTVVTTIKPLPACLVDEFQCSDGRCIKKQNVCNGKPDCSKGEDEQPGCECSEEQFKCHSGQCIERKFRCDKVLHCDDHSDEMNCTGCEGFQCASGECLWSRTVECDQHVNCLDLSDEMNCNVRRRGYSQCKNGLWINDYKFCDGVDDCFDNSDETDCSEHECNFLAEMACGNEPPCIVHEWKCDGHDDCPNGWDESNSTCGACKSDQFKCSNHNCIPSHQVCDGIKQCLAGTDETDCIQLYKNEDGTSSKSGVVRLKSSGQFLPICSDGWYSNITSEICRYFGHSVEGATSSFVTLTSAGLPSYGRYMVLEDAARQPADHVVLSRFNPTSSCPSKKIVSVTCQPSNCGERKVRPLVPFIVGGTLAPKGQWPWVVSISLLGKGVCGGAIVGPRWILTAAHCIITSESNYTLTPHYFEITAGTIRRTRSKGDTAQRQRVDKIILYPNITRFANGIYDYDLALMHLDGPLEYGDYLQPICLPSQGEIFPTNAQCYLAGWGFINTHEVTVNDLREAKMRLFNDTECNANSYNKEININSTICAGYISGVISGCKGDSGSPLMCKDNRNHWNVVGIMSYGTSGCDGQSSGRVNRMAKVSSASDWISSVIET